MTYFVFWKHALTSNVSEQRSKYC